MDMTIPEGVGTSCPGRLGDNTKVTSKTEDVTVHSCIMQVTIKQEESSDDDQRLHFCIKLFRKTQRLGHHPFAEGRHQSQRKNHTEIEKKRIVHRKMPTETS
jgi:hypothetical protein